MKEPRASEAARRSDEDGHAGDRPGDGPLWSRRRAVAGLAGALMLSGVRGVAGLLPAGLASTPRRDDELPPRTVGLRSLGGDFRFDPPGLRIEPGETVTWLNIGDFHTVTAFHPANAELFPGEIPLRIPEGAESFHSGMLGLDAGTQFERRFEPAGVYDYFCQPHYGFGMVGRVVVGDRAAADPAPASQLVEAARLQMPPVEAIFGRRGRAFEWGARINGVLLLRANRASDAPARAEALRDALASVPPEGLIREEADAGRFREVLDRFVKLAPEGGYERLVQLGDRLKAALY